MIGMMSVEDRKKEESQRFPIFVWCHLQTGAICRQSQGNPESAMNSRRGFGQL